MRLDQLPLRQPAAIDGINWHSLPDVDCQRLKELGISEGVTVEALHHGGLFGRGPIACRVGRMIVAMRRLHAAAILVRPLDGVELENREEAA